MLQPLAMIALFVVGIQLIDGTRWLVVFPPLAVLIVVWIGQAVHAHQRAIQLGAAPGGEVQVAVLMPLGVALLTLYWLVGGRHGSPSATLEEYVVAWMSNRPDAAANLFGVPPDVVQLAHDWGSQTGYLQGRVAQAAATYGPTSGLDPDSPFDNLRFGDPQTAANGTVAVTVDIVRHQRVETMVLGVIPTASQQTVLVEHAGLITLGLEPRTSPAWLPFGQLASSAWLIEGVLIPAEPVAP
jgi:hypothetical protein